MNQSSGYWMSDARLDLMTTNAQIEMLMRDMLFITWAVQPEALRDMVHQELELDTRFDSAGRPVAFVSAVCFRVAEVRSNVLPLPRMSFDQVNYRAYVKEGENSSVYFLDMKVNSRMITTLTGFLSVPVSYDDIQITAVESGPASHRYNFRSSGLQAEAVIEGRPESITADPSITYEFITQRLVGYASAGDNAFKIEVEHAVLEAVPARIEHIEAPRLEELGVLNADQARHPHSALYVRDAVFGTSTPSRVW